MFDAIFVVPLASQSCDTGTTALAGAEGALISIEMSMPELSRPMKVDVGICFSIILATDRNERLLAGLAAVVSDFLKGPLYSTPTTPKLSFIC